MKEVAGIFLLRGAPRLLRQKIPVEQKAAQGGIGSVRKHARSDKNFDRRVAKNGQHYFVLKASSGEVIGRSEMYSSTSARENGIKSVRTNGPNTRLDDLT